MNRGAWGMICLLFLFSPLCFTLRAQEYAPLVTNFTKHHYKASNQNWAIGQDSNGLMYFANNFGLLQFDGAEWKLYQVPNNKNIRSVMIDANDRIFVGSFEEFGYFEKNKTGELFYTSLSGKLKGYKMMNDEIWTITELNHKIYFQSFTSFFVFDGQQVTGFRTPYTFLFFNKIHNRIYVNTQQKGLCVYNESLQDFESLNLGCSKSPIIAILPYNHDLLLVSVNDGLFLYNGESCKRFRTQVDQDLKHITLNRALITRDSVIVLGSILDGVAAINKKGEKLWKLNLENALQNNTVLGMYNDLWGDIWLSLDKGISLLNLNSPLRYFTPFKLNIGTVYTTSMMSRNLFFGTNQGLYVTDYTGFIRNYGIVPVTLFSGIKGQIWDLSEFNGQLICGNNEETYSIEQGKIQELSPVKGGFCIKKGMIQGREVLVQGTYTNLCIYRRNLSGKWELLHTVNNFVNPIRYLEIDYQGTIWCSHFHEGLYKIQLTSDLKNIQQITHFKSLGDSHNAQVNVFTVNHRVVFSNYSSFFTYDDLRKEIVPYGQLNNALGEFKSAFRVVHFTGNKYWFIKQTEAALVQVEDQRSKIMDIVPFSAFANTNIDDQFTIVPISGKNSLFCLENGFVVYQFDSLNRNREPKIKALIRRIEITTNDKLTYLLATDTTKPVQLPYLHNSISFTSAYPCYSSNNDVYYRFKLDGFDRSWSVPAKQNVREYFYLPYGPYTFRMRITNRVGQTVAETSYSFGILPPFYWCTAAKIFYAGVLLLMGYGSVLFVKRWMRHHKDKIKQEQEAIRQKELEKQEQQIIKLEKENLETALSFKSKELASSTLSIIRKNEILVSIKEELAQQKQALGSQYPNKYYDKIVKMLDQNLSSEDDWAIFQTNFDRIHENFFTNLKRQYLDLTANDLRLCAFLHLNLSTKDIANLMNISVKGVEVGRYRLRKKLGIPPTKGLTEFMLEFR